MNKLLMTASLGLALFAHTDVLARGSGGPTLTDNIPPKLILEMNDTKNAGPIIWYEHNVMPPQVHWNYNYVGPSALGCRNGVFDARAEWWRDQFGMNDFTDRYIQNRTYFFRELAGPSRPIGEVPYSFTLRTQDLSGIKRILVSTPG